MDAAAAIRTARQRAGLSLREFARLAGTSHATLLAYERGLKVPRTDTLARLLRAAGFALDLEFAARADKQDGREVKGRELLEALELAAHFPARQEPALRAPRFGASS